MNTVLCKDCKHSNHSIWDNLSVFPKLYECRHPSNFIPGVKSLITGKVTKGTYESCATARVSRGICGPQGNLWTPRKSKHLFLLLKRV